MSSKINNNGVGLWNLNYTNYDINTEKTRETLLTVGNGYFGTRGAMEELEACNSNYPGTYMCGVYNKLTSEINDKTIEHEDFVNCPDWTIFKFKFDKDDDWINLNNCKILKINRNLNLKNGELAREIICEYNCDKQFKINSYRIASMDDYHIASIKYIFTPLNFSGNIFISTGINGNVTNSGVKAFKDLNNKHLTNYYTNINNNIIVLEATTSNSKITINETVKIICNNKFLNKSNNLKENEAYIDYEFDVKENESIEIEKILSIYNTLPDKNNKSSDIVNESSNKNDESSDIVNESPNNNDDSLDILHKLTDIDIRKKSENKLSYYNSYNQILELSSKAWEDIWDEIDVVFEDNEDCQNIIRLNLYHTIVSFSPHNKNFDASVTARGLHGEGYRGHVYWDEIYIMPFYCMHFPEAAKAMLMYRYKRLPQAKKAAEELGYQGAMFPWQSGLTGEEVCQKYNYNPISKKWSPDYNNLQKHVSLAIAHNIYTYFHYTLDNEFMIKYGLEMFWEICRFWVSKVKFNIENNRYSIKGVIGPDDFHERDKKTGELGVKDNAYTNVMTAWILHLGANFYENYEYKINEVINKTNVTLEEVKLWRKIANNMNVIIKDDIISQFDGFFDLQEFDFEEHTKKYGNTKHLDSILEAEGLDPDDYKICKQPDTLMLFYNLTDFEVSAILRSMGYKFHISHLKKNLNYYFKRSSHGASLSKIVHAHVASIVNEFELSEKLYFDALNININDTQGTISEGIHTGVMCGTILTALFTFAGINLHRNQPEFFQPKKPKKIGKISGKFRFRDKTYKF